MSPYINRFYLIPWTIWCGLSFFVLTGIAYSLIFILLLFPFKKTYYWAHLVPMYIAKTIAIVWGTRVKISGLEHFDQKKQYIFVGNHRSMLDAIISSGFIPNPKKFIGKAEILTWPFLGYILGKLYIPVKRQDKKSRQWSMEQLFIKMKEGYSMVIFAEGTCNTTDKALLDFKDGAFISSTETQTPIVPFVIKRADKLWKREIWLISPGTVELVFLPIVSPYSKGDEHVESMKLDIYNQVLRELENQ